MSQIVVSPDDGSPAHQNDGYDGEELQTMCGVDDVERTDCETTDEQKSAFVQKLESELMCTICKDYLIQAVTIGCSHTFCEFCITEWKRRTNRCPLCRQPIVNQVRQLVVDNVVEAFICNVKPHLIEQRRQSSDQRREERTTNSQKLEVNETAAETNPTESVVELTFQSQVAFSRSPFSWPMNEDFERRLADFSGRLAEALSRQLAEAITRRFRDTPPNSQTSSPNSSPNSTEEPDTNG